MGCSSGTDAPAADGAVPATDLASPSDGPAAPAGDMATLPATGFPDVPAPPVPSGRVLEVGAAKMYKKPCDALTVAMDGDTIQIDAATYAGDTCRVSANNLTIRAIGGRAVLDMNGVKPKECKATWVLGGNDISIEGVEFTGAHLRPADAFVISGACAADKNGAGLRLEGNNLTLRRCSFHDNDDGLLGGGNLANSVLIEYSEFHDNSFDGYSHNLYLGNAGQLTFRYNYSSHTNADGHLLKSRAKINVILYNRVSGETGPDSYEMNFPNGGTTYVIGNVIQQGNATSNRAMLDYASEGVTAGYDNHLYVVNNTFVSERQSGATFVQLNNNPICLLTNNLFSGTGSITNNPGNVTETNDLVDKTNGADFVDAAHYDYHLKAGAAAIGAGADPGMANGYSLVPVSQYVHPAGVAARPVKAKLDVGAFAGP